MEDMNSNGDALMFKEIFKDGRKLIVLASKIETEQWQLSVQNEYGISSSWLEYFPSAELAIDVGVNAIEQEGVAPFIGTEGFEYLFEYLRSDTVLKVKPD